MSHKMLTAYSSNVQNTGTETKLSISSKNGTVMKRSSDIFRELLYINITNLLYKQIILLCIMS